MTPPATPANLPDEARYWSSAQQQLYNHWQHNPDLARAHLAEKTSPTLSMDECIVLVATNAERLWQQGDTQQLTQILSALPETAFTHNPWLGYWRAQARAFTAPAWCYSELTNVWQHFHRHADTHGKTAAACAMIESLLLGWTNFSNADTWIAELDQLRTTSHNCPPALFARATAAMISALSYRQPDHPGMAWWRQQAEALIDHHRSAQILGSLGFPLYFHYLWQGDTSKRKRIAHWSLQLLNSADQPPLIHIGICVLQSIQALCDGEHSRLCSWVEQGRTLAQTSGVHLWDALLCAPLAYSAMSQDNVQQARQAIDQMAEAITMSGALDHAYYHHIAALVCLAEGDAQKAAAHVTQGLDCAANSGSPIAQAYCSFSGLMLARRYPDAPAYRDHYRVLDTLAKRFGSVWFDYLLQLADCYPGIAKSNIDAAKLVRLSEAGHQSGIYSFPWFTRREAAALIVQALEAGTHIPYLQEIVRRQQLTPPTDRVNVPHWPFPVRVYTLGQFAIKYDSPPDATQTSQRQRPLDLLQLIIAEGCVQVPVARLLECLWPEADGDYALQNLKTTVHRLRRLLGDNSRLDWQHNCLSLNTQQVWIDTLYFEKAVTALRGTTQLAALERAIEHYRGHFLADSGNSAPWIQATQARLRDSFLDASAQLIQHYFAKGQIERARAVADRALVLEPLGLPVWNALISGYEISGDRSAAEIARNRLKELWHMQHQQCLPDSLVG